MVVDVEEAGGGVDAEGFEAEAGEADAATGGDEELVAGEFCAVVEEGGGLAASALDAGDVGTLVDGDALGGEDGLDDLGGDGVFSGEDAVGALDDGDVDTEAGEDLAEFAADGAAAEDEE